MNKLVNQMLQAAKSFSVLDYGVFKVCLITLGMLIGIFQSKTLRKIAGVIAGIFTASWAYMLYRVFFYRQKPAAMADQDDLQYVSAEGL